MSVTQAHLSLGGNWISGNYESGSREFPTNEENTIQTSEKSPFAKFLLRSWNNEHPKQIKSYHAYTRNIALHYVSPGLFYRRNSIDNLIRFNSELRYLANIWGVYYFIMGVIFL